MVFYFIERPGGLAKRVKGRGAWLKGEREGAWLKG